jgi:hypothetical protein
VLIADDPPVLRIGALDPATRFDQLEQLSALYVRGGGPA